MGDGFGFVGGLIGLVLVVCFFLALIGTAIYAFFIGLIFYGCSYVFAYLAWNYKTSREKYLMFFIYLALGIAVCVGIVYFIFDTESIGAIDIILYVVSYCLGLYSGYKKGIKTGFTVLNDDLRNNLLSNETYKQFMNNYKEIQDKFNSLGGQLIKASDYYEHIQYFDYYIDIRCFDDVLVLMKNIDRVHEIEKNLISEDSRKWISDMYRNYFNEEKIINNSNIVDTYIEIIKVITKNVYLECEVSQIVNYKLFNDTNNSHIEILLNNDTIVDLPGCYYSALKNYYPNLENRNLY